MPRQLTIGTKYVTVDNTALMSFEELEEWADRWPNFPPHELHSDDYSVKLTLKSLDALQRVRDQLGLPIVITCAWRTKKHNERVKSRAGERSRHRKGDAYDIAVPTMSYAKKVESLALEAGFTAVGRYPSRHFIHIDMRPPKTPGRVARWGAPSWKK